MEKYNSLGNIQFFLRISFVASKPNIFATAVRTSHGNVRSASLFIPLIIVKLVISSFYELVFEYQFLIDG